MRHGLLANESKCVNPLWNPCLLSSACFNCEPKLTKNPTPLLLLPSSLPPSLAKKKKATQALLPFYSCVAGSCVWIRRDRHTCTSAIQNEYTSLQRYRMSYWPLISFLCWRHYRRFEAIYTRLLRRWHLFLTEDFYLPFSRNRRGCVSNAHVVQRKLDLDFSRTSDLFARTDVASSNLNGRLYTVLTWLCEPSAANADTRPSTGYCQCWHGKVSSC